MPEYRANIAHQRYSFSGLRALLAKASPLRSGDQLAGVAAANARERVAAQTALADVPLTRFLEEPLVPYDDDEVTRLILDTHDRAAFAPLADLTVGAFREWLLSYETTTEVLRAVAPGVTPEMAAAVSKVMRNQDLVLAASKCRVVTRFRNTLGLPGRLSVRLQPNHPTDDAKGIAAAILDGLLYGAGDACIGINPATDNVAVTRSLIQLVGDLIAEYEIPTQSCVLAHVTTTLKAVEAGTPIT
jgi:ethanolamine ammonia-lyase large subunit